MTYIREISCVLILAGGKGTRSKDPKLPKILQEISSTKRLIDLHIENFAKAKVPLVYFLISYGANEVIAYVNKIYGNTHLGTELKFIVDSENVKGTTDVVLDALIQIPKVEDIVLFLGDEIFFGDITFLYNKWKSSRKKVGVVVHRTIHPKDSDTLLISDSGEILNFMTKGSKLSNNRDLSNLSATGILFIDLKYQHNIKSITNDITSDLIQSNLENVIGIQSVDYIKDTGTPKRLDSARLAYESKTYLRFQNKISAIFIDRDGTIIPDVGDNRTGISGSDISRELVNVIREVNEASIPIFVVTNQPGVAKGHLTHKQVREVHRNIDELLMIQGAYIDGYIYCPHHDESGFKNEIRWLKIDCKCRKPKPGMLFHLSQELRLDLSKSIFIGDSQRDELAATAANCNFEYSSYNETGFKGVAAAIQRAKVRITEIDNY